MFISWMLPAPEGQNGIITSYSLQILKADTSQMHTYKRNGSHTDILIEGLQPSVEYGCSLAAENEAGLGPFSDPLTVSMPSDG